MINGVKTSKYFILHGKNKTTNLNIENYNFYQHFFKNIWKILGELIIRELVDILNVKIYFLFFVLVEKYIVDKNIFIYRKNYIHILISS